MTLQRIELKGLSPDQVDQLLPEGLISLCWRGSVAHGMYVPKSDPNSIDDKDVMGVYIGPLEHTKQPTDKNIDESMGGNVCRCATYPRIREAIKNAAAELRKGGA